MIEESLRRRRAARRNCSAVDRRCHEIIWAAAGNRFLTDTLDMLYAHSDRVWHMYLADVADTRHAVDEHIEILELLRAGDADGVRRRRRGSRPLVRRPGARRRHRPPRFAARQLGECRH